MRLLAVSSGGGHWDELMAIQKSLDWGDVVFATTRGCEVAPAKSVRVLDCITDCNRNQPMSVLRCLLDAYALVRQVRPHIVVSTGAAPGLLALVFGWMSGANTYWIDSIANAERLSLSGRLASIFATQTVTQWPHLAKTRSAIYLGSLL